MARAMGWHKPENFAGSSIRAILVGLFVSSGGLLFGYDVGVINGVLAMDVFQNDFATDQTCRDENDHIDLCPKDSSLIVAILSGGAVVGSILAAPAGDSIGRRKTLLLAVLTFCIGAIFQVCAQATPMLLVGRALAGVAVGATSVLVPLYQSETAPKWIRGSIICAYQLSITVGILSATIINVITAGMNSSAAYRIPIGLQLVPGIILACGIMLLPETPRFLVKKGHNDAAGISLSRFRRLDITHPALVNELQEIIANHQYEMTLGHDTYRALFTSNSSLWHRTLTGCGLQMLQQLTGINFVMYYGTTFWSCRYRIVGKTEASHGWCVGYGSMPVYNQRRIHSKRKIVSRLRQRIQHGAHCLLCDKRLLLCLLVGTCYLGCYFRDLPSQVARKGNVGVNDFCIIAIVFVWFMVYETSRMTLEQIDEMYERVGHAWESPGFNPSWSFQEMRSTGWAINGQAAELQSATSTSNNVSAPNTEDGGNDRHSVRSNTPPNSATPIANIDFSY